MFDPMYSKYVMTADYTVQSGSSGGINQRAVMNFNFLEEIVYDLDTPKTFYETLSIVHTFNPFGCERFASITDAPAVGNSDAVVANIDSGDLEGCDGFLMAIQGRVGEIWYAPHSSNIYNVDNKLDMSIIRTASSSASLAVLCKFSNLSGVSMCCSVQTTSKDDSLERLVACIAMVSKHGLLAFRVDDYTTEFCRDAFNVLETWFSKVVLYKPGTMSCLKRGSYLIARAKRDIAASTLPNAPALTEQIATLEAERKRAKKMILLGAITTQQVEVNFIRSYYLGK